MASRLVALVAVGVVCLLGPSGAGAATRYVKIFGCSAHGFTGTFKYEIVNGYFRWYYKINKGTNVGGNRANVNIWDGGTNPFTNWYSPDSMIQDNAYHPYPPHARGLGGFSVQFIFDRSHSGDPRCTVDGGDVEG